MKNKTTRKKTIKVSGADNVLLKSRRVFSSYYKNKPESEDGTYILTARETFETLVSSDAISVTEAHSFLNNNKKLDTYLSKARVKAEKEKKERLENTLSKIQNNTNTMKTAAVAIAVTLACSFAYDFWIKPKLTDIFKKEAKKVTEQKVPLSEATEPCTNVHNGDVIYLISDCKDGQTPTATREALPPQRATTIAPKAQP